MPPIKPNEIVMRELPEVVYDCFNLLISRNLRDGRSSTVSKKDVIDLLEQKGFNKSIIYGQRLLDIEEPYRVAGWDVVYHKPDFNEVYEGEEYYVFTVKKGEDNSFRF